MVSGQQEKETNNLLSNEVKTCFHFRANGITNLFIAMVKEARVKLRKKRSRRVMVKGTANIPRLSVFKSNRRVYLQLIDDEKDITLAGALSGVASGKLPKSLAARAAGKKLGEMAAKKGIKRAAFDRGGYKFHGRVKEALLGAEEGGLVFSRANNKAE